MKKIITLFMAAALCFALACPAFAAEDVFVPSIGDKDGPDIVDTELETDCVVITSILQAKEQSTDISQDERDLLLDVYEQILDSSMQLPISGTDLVVRELVDISFKHDDCVEDPDHEDKEDWIEQPGTSLSVTLQLGVQDTTEVSVYVYVDNQWIQVTNVQNRGDGTVEIEFEHFGPVAICVPADAETVVPPTGDVAGQSLLLWAALMIVSFVAIVVLLINRRRMTK